MKSKILGIALVISLMMCVPAKAEELRFEKAWATAYSITGTTATGSQTVEGRTIAGKREWFNDTLILWRDDGDGVIKPENYIGTYICEDTGGATIQSGACVDVYISDYSRAVQFGSKRVIIQIIESEG